MDSGMISKIKKAKRYAEERDRIRFQKFEVTFNGTNNTHNTQYQDGKWQCTCDFFKSRGLCCHTMALEIILEGMVSSSAESSEA